MVSGLLIYCETSAESAMANLEQWGSYVTRHTYRNATKQII